MAQDQSMLLLLFLSAIGMAVTPGDAREIVRRAVDNELNGAAQPRDYTWKTDLTEKKFNREGAVESSKSKTTETVIIYGKQFERLIARDGKPLQPADEAKEKTRFDREIARRKAMTEESRLSEDRAARSRDQKDKEFLRQVPEIFDFALSGEQNVNGRQAYVIDFRPKPGARTRGIFAASVSKLYGRIWIDKMDERWVRVECEARDNIRFGLFLGNIGPGSRLTFEQVRMAEGVWLPSRVLGRLKARLVVKGVNVEEDTVYRDYRRFSADAQILSTEEK